jgi:DNA polymerase epsilon subunit 3
MTSMESYSLPKSTIEFEPPTAGIRRLLKTALPNSTHVSKDSCAAITRACGIFVLYVTSCANDLAREGRRSTISAKDVLGALQVRVS